MDIEELKAELRRRALMADDNMGDSEAFDNAADTLESLQSELAAVRQEMEEARKDACAQIVALAAKEGWGMRNDDPFEDAVQAICDEYLRAARKQTS